MPGLVLAGRRVDVEHAGLRAWLDFVVRGYRVDAEEGDARATNVDDPGLTSPRECLTGAKIRECHGVQGSDGVEQTLHAPAFSCSTPCDCWRV